MRNKFAAVHKRCRIVCDYWASLISLQPFVLTFAYRETRLAIHMFVRLHFLRRGVGIKTKVCQK